jgi:hypothetical protein
MMTGCRFDKQTAYAVRGRAFSFEEEVTGDNEVLVKVDSHNDIVLSSS